MISVWHKMIKNIVVDQIWDDGLEIYNKLKLHLSNVEICSFCNNGTIYNRNYTHIPIFKAREKDLA